MPRDLEPSLAESTFLWTLLHNHSLRLPSNRQLVSHRGLSISFPSSSLVLLRLGETTVTVGISCTVVKTLDDRPNDGQFSVSLDASSFLTTNSLDAQDEERQIITILEKSVRRSRALETESLCIQSGKLCFLIHATCTLLNHDGNIIDALCLALTTALKRFRKPCAEVRGGSEVIVYSPKDRVPEPLVLNFLPICLTFSFFKRPFALSATAAIGEDGASKSSMGEQVKVLVDCTKEEEALRNGYLILTVNNNHEIGQIIKAGGISVNQDIIKQCLGQARVMAMELTKVIEVKVKEDVNLNEIGENGKSESERINGDRPTV